MMVQRFDLRQLAVMTTGVFLATLLVGRFNAAEPSDRTPADKRQVALMGGLELENAVHALKNAILRGAPAYRADFDRSMHEVERAADLYRAYGALSPEEAATLDLLRTEVPLYRNAMETVGRMREGRAPITEIDRAVKGEDRPISAAFEKLQAIAAAQVQGEQGLRADRGGGLALTALVCALLSGVLVAAGDFALGRVRARGGSLRESAMRVIRWEEEKQMRASRRLRDGVCQSFAGAMCLLRGVDKDAADLSGGTLRARIDSVLQDAIRDAQAIAVDLCPPRARDHGLLASLASIWADARRRCPQLKLAATSDIREIDLPQALAHEIERLAPMAVDWARSEPGALQLVWTLSRERRRLRIGIGIQTGPQGPAGSPTPGEPPWHSPPAEAIAARLRLSGAATRGVENVPGGRALAAYWRLP